MSRAAVVAAARGWLGTPFHHQGRLQGVGCDCVGLVVGVAESLGVPVQDQAGYSREPQGRALRDALDAQLVPIPAPVPGCVVLMRIGREERHVGIVATAPTGALSIIHAWLQAGEVVEHHLDAVWLQRIVQSYEIPIP